MMAGVAARSLTRHSSTRQMDAVLCYSRYARELKDGGGPVMGREQGAGSRRRNPLPCADPEDKRTKRINARPNSSTRITEHPHLAGLAIVTRWTTWGPMEHHPGIAIFAQGATSYAACAPRMAGKGVVETAVTARDALGVPKE
jgi:hypothetical protein